MIKLTKSQIKQFNEKGFLVIKSFYPAKILKEALNWLKSRDPKKLLKVGPRKNQEYLLQSIQL